MAKYNTAIKGYYQGASQIEQFVRSEIGTEKEYLSNLHKARQGVKKALEYIPKDQRDTPKTKRKLEAAWETTSERLKTEHHKQYGNFLLYEKNMNKLFDSNELIGKDTLNNLLNLNKDTQKNTLFNNPKIKWNSEAGAKAMQKFTNMVLKNDQKKLEYYRDCLAKSNKPIRLKDVLDCPTPVTRKATKADLKDLTQKVRDLSEKLTKTESLTHINSPEFKAMKRALNSLNQGLTNGLSPHELGSRLEALQHTSMVYATTKGIGMQSTQRGKERLDLALDLCGLSAEHMDFYASKERRADLDSFERDNFEEVLTEEMEDEYADAELTEGDPEL